jgi:hypothetical protein
MRLRSIIAPLAVWSLGLGIATVPAIAQAGEADVVAVKLRPGAAADQVSFDVTIRSRDRGWDYYAERFEVVAPDGTLLGTRVLLHPHEDEQPFTRELDNVRIPAGVRSVVVRAWMKRGSTERAAGGEILTVQLARPQPHR